MPTTTVSIPLLDLRPQFAGIRDDVMRAITRVIESQHFILGAEVEQFEAAIASYCNTSYAIGCASGSDALIIALMAAGVGPGDEVVTVPYTFFATASAIERVGAKTVFVDVERHTFNMDIAALHRALESNRRIKAIIPVHLFGGCADMDPILRVAADRGIPVIEDAAQSIGAEYRGVRAGSMGTAAAFSFFPTKNLGAFGDAGMVTTNDSAFARKLKAIRVHGSETKYVHESIGVNSRLDALQAAVLGVKLRHLDEWTAQRQHNAELYRTLFLAKGTPVGLPTAADYQTRHVYNQFVITGERRDHLRKFLADNGVGSEVYYPIPLHRQRCFEHLGYQEGEFPVSEALARESLALPIYPELDAGNIRSIAELIHSFYSERK